MATRALIYCRISSDPEHDRLGVTRQEADCRALCEREGYEVAGVYVDDDASAYSGKPRREYDQLCADLKDYVGKVVVAWHPDRLHRSPRELEDFIDLLDAVRAKVLTVQAGHWDLSTPSGRMIARQLGAVARYESEHKSERIRRKMQELADHGKPHGGSKRPYGYADDRVTIVPAEANVIRAAAKRIIAGDTLRSVAVWLNDTGTTTTFGKAWTPSGVRTMLISPRYAGLRAVGRPPHERIVGDAVWRAVLDRAMFEECRAILTDPARRTNRSARRYLLTGLLRCGRCGATLVSRMRYDTRTQNGYGVRAYVCARDPGREGCGRLAVRAEQLEAWVADAVAEYVADPEVGRGLRRVTVPDDSVSAELADIDARMATLGADYGRGAIPDVVFHAGVNSLNQRRTELAAMVRAVSRTPAVLAVYADDPGALARDWPRLRFDRQRAIIAAVLDTVTIGPAVPGAKTFDPARIVDVAWR
jgi:DNA invertase Pin-like site-specific DNA recombinase